MSSFASVMPSAGVGVMPQAGPVPDAPAEPVVDANKLGPASASPINLVIVGALIIAVVIIVVIVIYTIYKTYRTPTKAEMTPTDSPGSRQAQSRTKRRAANEEDEGEDGGENEGEAEQEDTRQRDIFTGRPIEDIEAEAKAWANRGKAEQRSLGTTRVLTPPSGKKADFELPPELEQLARDQAQNIRRRPTTGGGSKTKKPVEEGDTIGEKMVSTMSVKPTQDFSPPSGPSMNSVSTGRPPQRHSAARQSNPASEILEEIMADADDDR